MDGTGTPFARAAPGVAAVCGNGGAADAGEGVAPVGNPAGLAPGVRVVPTAGETPLDAVAAPGAGEADPFLAMLPVAVL